MFLMSLLLGCDSTLTLVVKDETNDEGTQSGDNDGHGNGGGQTDCETEDGDGDVEDTGTVEEEEPEEEVDPRANCVGVEEQSFYSRNQIYAQYEYTHTYDELGREVKTEFSYGQNQRSNYTIAYEYDENGNIVKYSYTYGPRGQTYTYEYLFVYDTDDRLVEYGYDADNNGVYEYMVYYTYDDSGLSRQGLTVYDYGYTVYTSTFEEILDQAGHILQQEYDQDGNGVVDYRVLNLYAGDLLMQTTSETIYDSNRDGVLEYYAYSVVYDYDENGFLTGQGQDYDQDGVDEYQILYTNNADGQPTLIESIQTYGYRTYRMSTANTYDADGRIETATLRNYRNKISQVNEWDWTCN